LINQFPVTYLFADNDKIVIDFLLSVGVFLFVLTKILNKESNNIIKENLLYVVVIPIIVMITFCIHIYSAKKILPYNYNIHAYTLAKEGSFNKASNLIKKVLVVKPGDQRAQLNYGMTLFIKNEFKLALNVYNRIIKVDPDNEIAHTQAGIIYLNQNKIEKAIRHFEKVLKKNSRSIKAHEKMGYIRYVQGKMFESRYHFEKVRELNPNNAKSYLNLAIAASFSGQVDQSIKLLQESLFIDPLCVEAHDNLGAALVSRGNIEEAINHFYIALQLNPEYKQSQNNLESITKGIFNLAKKFEDNLKYDKAIEMYTKLSKFRPDWSAYMFFNIGRIYSKLSQAGQSICWLKRAVHRNVDLWEVFEKDRAYSYIQQHAHFKSVLLKKDAELLICDKAIE
jgi:tetratricopeptide (TPR) repeat protein